jgi:hypothetical protein
VKGGTKVDWIDESESDDANSIGAIFGCDQWFMDLHGSSWIFISSCFLFLCIVCYLLLFIYTSWWIVESDACFRSLAIASRPSEPGTR